MYGSVAGVRSPRFASRQKAASAVSRDPSAIEPRSRLIPERGGGSPTGIAAARSVLATASHAGTRADPSAATGMPTVTVTQERRSDPLAVERQTGAAARWGMAAVYLLLAYEWLLSGLNKDLSGTFRAGLANRIRGSLAGNPHGWYVSFVERVVLPHVAVFAAAVEIGEVLVAAGLLWGAALWARPAWFPVGLRPWLGGAVAAALLGAAVMELNYYLLAGQGWPWLKTGDPFVEGLGVDGLVLLVSVALLPVQLITARQSSGGGSATTGRFATGLIGRKGGSTDMPTTANRLELRPGQPR
jgi:thiosulfate dehydrogenase [quinone] large subunit